MDETGWIVPTAAMNQPRLSKSTYLTGKQCHLRLWHHFHARHLAAPDSEALQLVFDTGHEVGDFVCHRYHGGHLCEGRELLLAANPNPAKALFEQKPRPGVEVSDGENGGIGH